MYENHIGKILSHLFSFHVRPRFHGSISIELSYMLIELFAKYEAGRVKDLF